MMQDVCIIMVDVFTRVYVFVAVQKVLHFKGI